MPVALPRTVVVSLLLPPETQVILQGDATSASPDPNSASRDSNSLPGGAVRVAFNATSIPVDATNLQLKNGFGLGPSTGPVKNNFWSRNWSRGTGPFCSSLPRIRVDAPSIPIDAGPIPGDATANRVIPNIPIDARWSQNGMTVAGGNGEGNAINQLNGPFGLFVDDDQTMIIADYRNHRIVQWKMGDTSGQVIAGGKSQGNRLDQLNGPTDVLIDKETDSLIICDRDNGRVVRWSRRSGTTRGQILIDNINCYGLFMDDQRYLYVSDTEKHEVRRYQIGDKNGIIVAGGNGRGAGLNQLNWPTYIFVDQQQTVYVSDNRNHRVMKWNKGAKEGIAIAGGQSEGNARTQLSHPNGLFVDTLGTIYVADSVNDRVMRWPKGAKQGTVIVSGNRQGVGANQFNHPDGLFFNRQGNLYVVDFLNNRVQFFSIQ
ncbi:unnamed protein product [Rotaria sp. Silwood1]|nr:unnamed protein product [Rotaria sp. Silwood1]